MAHCFTSNAGDCCPYIAIYSYQKGRTTSALTVQTDYGDCCPYIVQYIAIHATDTLLFFPEKRTPLYHNESVSGTLDDFSESCAGNYSGNNRKLPQHMDCDTFLSYPQVGKHVSFDGSWLHGALPALAQPGGNEPSSNTSSPKVKSSTKKTKTKRVTFLVNVWLNHAPSTACRLPDSVASVLAPVGAFHGAFAKETTSNSSEKARDGTACGGKSDNSNSVNTSDAVATIDVAAIASTELTTAFKHADKKIVMTLDLPSRFYSEGHDTTAEGGSFALKGTGGVLREEKSAKKRKVAS